MAPIRNPADGLEEPVRMAHITRLEALPHPPDLPEILDLFRSTGEPQPGAAASKKAAT
jgi:hypothetical protein